MPSFPAYIFLFLPFPWEREKREQHIHPPATPASDQSRRDPTRKTRSKTGWMTRSPGPTSSSSSFLWVICCSKTFNLEGIFIAQTFPLLYHASLPHASCAQFLLPSFLPGILGSLRSMWTSLLLRSPDLNTCFDLTFRQKTIEMFPNSSNWHFCSSSSDRRTSGFFTRSLLYLGSFCLWSSSFFLSLLSLCLLFLVWLTQMCVNHQSWQDGSIIMRALAENEERWNEDGRKNRDKKREKEAERWFGLLARSPPRSLGELDGETIYVAHNSSERRWTAKNGNRNAKTEKNFSDAEWKTRFSYQFMNARKGLHSYIC